MGSQITPKNLSLSKLLLVEGKDECIFFDAFFKHLGVIDIELRETFGKDKFEAEFSAILNDAGFGGVKSLGIIQDADVDRDAAFRRVSNVLKKHGLSCPSTYNAFASGGGRKVGVFIMPGNSDTGMLENLCLQTVADHPAIQPMENFFGSLTSVLAKRDPPNAPRIAGVNYYPSNEPKAKVQAFLSAMHEIVYHVGMAADKGIWNFGHPALADIKAFLEQLRA